mmetsp:Transcript_14546/g.58058  ORF Transcript_14546/g.58058 Transcript_14546/m.58058 type:complete len:363 (-) Transcript_14546:1129-2217(-)
MRAEVVIRRVRQEVRDARGVDVGVLLDLALEVALVVVARSRQEAPVPIEGVALVVDDGPDAVVEVGHLAHEVGHVAPTQVRRAVVDDQRVGVEPVPGPPPPSTLCSSSVVVVVVPNNRSAGILVVVIFLEEKHGVLVPPQVAAEVVELGLEHVFVDEELIERRAILALGVVREDLVLQLLHDERRAPPHHLLDRVRVDEHVVADIENVVGRAAEELLDVPRRAAAIDRTFLGLVGLAQQGVADRREDRRRRRRRCGRRGPRVAELIEEARAGVDDEFVARDVLGREEGGFARRDEDAIEEVAPVGVVAEDVAHHDVGVPPTRVGDENELLTGRALVGERGAQFRRVALREPLGIGRDGGFER